jgi:hypothetical protein
VIVITIYNKEIVMNPLKNKLNAFLTKNKAELPKEDEEFLSQRDGLFERREIVDKKYVTRNGKQLLREQLYK